VALQSDGVLDVDLPAVSITGSVSLNGAALPTATADRGSVAFTRAAAEGTGAISISLGTNAPATYAVTLLAGHYVVSHAANAGSCGGTTPPSVPCASQELLGCN
jgi:hypothetical protein